MVSITKVRINKWLNLAIFFVIDFLLIVLITSVNFQEIDRTTASTNSSELLGFVIFFKLNLPFTLLIFLATFSIRIILMYFSVKQKLERDELIKIYSKDEDFQFIVSKDNQNIGDTNFLADIVNDISKRLRVNITSAYVNISPVPYTFTINLIPLPFKQKIMLILNSNTVKILRKEETEAQIYHELGHVSNAMDNAIRIVFTSPRLFLQLAYWYIYIRIGIGILEALINFDLITGTFRSIFLLLAIIFFRLSEIIAISFLQRSNRCIELLADWNMYKHTGLETSINTLVKSGQRLEAIDAFYEEVIWLDSLYIDPFTKQEKRRIWQWLSKNKISKPVFINSILPIFPDDLVNEDIARSEAPYFFINWRLKEYRNAYGLNIEDTEIEKLAKDSQPVLLKQRKEYLESLDIKKRPKWVNRDENTFDWRTADLDKDHHLSMKEIETLIKTLKEKPELHLFENELHLQAYERDHPTIRERIIFLYENHIQKEAKNES